MRISLLRPPLARTSRASVAPSPSVSSVAPSRSCCRSSTANASSSALSDLRRTARSLSPSPLALRSSLLPPPYLRRSFSQTPSLSLPPSSSSLDMSLFPPERIRNFSVIAHIDHGKSTLSDRLLEATGTISAGGSTVNKQVLDKLKVERERGITVKAQTVSMVYHHPADGKDYLLNLIDTPGHVDFAYEVSRSLAACEGALLLVDCTQGVQAQTISVHGIAVENKLELIAVMNKTDLQHAAPRATALQLSALFDLPPSQTLSISAKSGLGVPLVLSSVVERIPPPTGSPKNPFKGLVVDSEYDRFRGVVSLVAVKEGSLRKGDRIASAHTGKKYEVLDVGVRHPEEESTKFLQAGQVGFVVCNMKAVEEATVGDTFHKAGEPVEPLPGFKPTKAMVFAGVFPLDANEFPRLEESVNRLMLSDRSVTVQRETSHALGQGLRLGFLGTLHMDVFRQRLEDEYNSDVIITAPSVPYKLVDRDGVETIISNPTDFPDVVEKARWRSVEEPMITATILVPEDFIGPMMELCTGRRGVQLSYSYLESGSGGTAEAAAEGPESEQPQLEEGGLKSEGVSSNRALLRYQIPMAEIVTNFFDELKSLSSGFASLDYEDAGWSPSDSVKMTININGNTLDALSMIVERSQADGIARHWCAKLRDLLPRQQYEMKIQAMVGSKAIASERVSPVRKDVLVKVTGLDRKRKQLDKQKAGKQRMKKFAGNIELSQEIFYDVLSTNKSGSGGGKKGR